MGAAGTIGNSRNQSSLGARIRGTIVVDADIDVTNDQQVWWALCSRMDPVVDIEVVKRCWSTSLDPMSYPREKPVFNNRMVIDACRPWERLQTFPKVTEAGPELKRKVIEKWRSVLPEISD
ncbi:MAG: hypothetical protein DMG12_01065 [Acidobacteria bacterium]|nr:MAG: hypothetical protein DMG12_01065 [Acidobacteriota bacterium]